jgi:CheY-like chemotaxis protein
MAKLAVLIAEDEFLIAADTSRIVSQLGCNVLGPAGELSDVLAIIREEKVDAALLDVSLSGGEKVYPAAAQLRGRHVPFAFLTAYGRDGVDPEFEQEALINKPFMEEDLRCFLEGVRGDAFDEGA